MTCALFLLACGRSDPSGPVPTWTILVYLDGDNDLSGYAVRDLAEMRDATPSPEVTVLVQLDLPGSTTRRYRIAANTVEQLVDLGELDMAAPQTLTDFLVWAKMNFPADRTVLVLWDHGFGWDQGSGPSQPKPVVSRALFVDWDNGGSRLANHQVKKAIVASGLRLDVLGFDACTMGNLETFYEFRDAADVLIASEEESESNGWDYRALLSSLAAQPSMSIEAFAAEAVRTYRNFYETSFYSSQPGYEKRLTLSAVRTAPLASLAVEVDVLAESLTTAMQDPHQSAATVTKITTARTTAQEIDRYLQPYVYVDLADLDSRLSTGTNIQPLISQAMIAEYHGSARPNAHGISIVFFMSRSKPTYDVNYKNYDLLTNTGNGGDFINEFNWDEFLAAYYAAAGL